MAVKRNGIEQVAGRLTEEVVFLAMSFGMPGNRAPMDAGKVRTTADKAALHLSKELLDSDELRAIYQKHHVIRDYARRLALPTRLGGGSYMMALGVVQKFEAFYERQTAELAELVEEFFRAYPKLKREARERLKGEYDPTDYPDELALRQEFTSYKAYVAADVPEKLTVLNAALAREEVKRTQAAMVEAVREGRAAMRVVMQELVAHLVDRLQPGEDGKAKRFGEATVRNLAEFLDELFPAQNRAMADGDLARLVDTARKTLAGVSVEGLKEDADLRAVVLDKMGGVKKALDALVEDAPGRAIRFAE